MHRLEEDDPTIRYARDPQTKELLLSGQGQLHIEVTVAKLKRRFGVDVNLKPPRIPYRETITVPVEAHGRHKKQTGGHGQFGDCKIRMEPLPRGSDFEFADDIFGGSIPRQFVPAVEKGIQDARMRGFLAGYPASTSRSPSMTARITPSTATSCRSRWPDRWPSRTAWPGAADDPRTGDVGRDLRAKRLRRRPHGRPERPPRAHQRHGHARHDDVDSRAGAHGRDAHLRAAPHVRHGRPRLVSHGILALRRGASHLQQKIIAAAKAERAGVEVEEV